MLLLCGCNQVEGNKIENKISAEELQKVYLQNEIAFTEKYKNKVFEGMGNVSSVRENITQSNSVWVTMIEYDTPHDRYITCETSDRTFSSELSDTDTIHFIGTVDYNPFRGVVLKDCLILASINENGNLIKHSNDFKKSKWRLATCVMGKLHCHLVEQGYSDNQNGILTFKGYIYDAYKMTNISADRNGESKWQVDCKNKQFRLLEGFEMNEKTNRVEKRELNYKYVKIDAYLKADDASKYISAFCS